MDGIHPRRSLRYRKKRGPERGNSSCRDPHPALKLDLKDPNSAKTLYSLDPRVFNGRIWGEALKKAYCLTQIPLLIFIKQSVLS